jgi:hypothetical protein
MGDFSMRSHLFLFATVLLVLLTGCRNAERISEPHPDLNGVWIGPATNLEPPAPLTAKGQALFDASKPLYGPRSVPVADSNDPVNTCDPQGFPRILFLRSPLSGMEIIQTPNRVLQVFKYQSVFREIWTDGRPLPADVGGSTPQSPEPRWYGYSIGHWSDDGGKEGTFIVETTGAVETWGDEEGHPHSLGAHIEERYRLLDRDSLELIVRVEDPELFQKPFIASKQVFKRGKELGEQMCVPSAAYQYLELIAKPAAATK